MVCPHGQGGRGLSQYGHFSDKGEESKFFAILCGRLLWTAPNYVTVSTDRNYGFSLLSTLFN